MGRQVLFLILTLLHIARGKRHTITLKNDIKPAILCSKFGYFKGGFLSLSVEKLNADLHDVSFTLDKSGTSGIASVLDAKHNTCFRGEPPRFLHLYFDPVSELMYVRNMDSSLEHVIFEYGAEDIDAEVNTHASVSLSFVDDLHLVLTAMNLETRNNLSLSTELNRLLRSTPGVNFIEGSMKQSTMFVLLRRLAEITLPKDVIEHARTPVGGQKITSEDFSHTTLKKAVSVALEMVYRYTTSSGSVRVFPYKLHQDVLNIQFTVRFPNATEEGLYSLYVHNCPPSSKQADRKPMNLVLKITEKNPKSYLSAGDQPLPLLYSVLCCLYLIASIIWWAYLRTSVHLKFRIHYLMLAVILVKAISLAFHGINSYVIGKHGVEEEGWAVMYYITHFIRGALLFITILLIGAGWAFVKHMLTPKERTLFLVVIPLQILANVATIVIEESEEGSARFALWKEIFIFVDLICCGAILFPVVWSIRHLQTASQTDGKAAMNLRNLRLFRHFYISVICYVYFTRVIAYLLSITVAYSLTWVIELFRESVTFIFFVTVGYTFRPVSDNPYLLVSTNEDEEDILMERLQLEDVWSQSGRADGVVHLDRAQPSTKKSNKPSTGITNPAFIGRSAVDSESQLNHSAGEQVP